ncbi:DUF1269 domain-containing protein [Acaryochloris thomasi]|nr:DUF1269 domain-containing protein [Acaryochloris thomasi]
MNKEEHQRAIGVFARRLDTEQALHELKEYRFPMDKVSVIAKDDGLNDRLAETDVTVTEHTGNKADEGAATGAAAGGAAGTLTGLLVGLGTLAIPGVGPIMLAGATATALATTVAGGAIGAAAGGLTGALIGLGIPEEQAKVYDDYVQKGYYLVTVDGTEQDIRRAEAILTRRGIQGWGVYQLANKPSVSH